MSSAGRKPTIKDVSRLAGVSIGTVSNVVNGHPHISAKTRRQVDDAIQKLGYKPSRAAKSLPKGRTGLLGYRMPDARMVNTTMDVFLHQVVDSAGEEGMEVLLFTPQQGQTELDAYEEVLSRGGVDAFVLASIEYDDPRLTFLSSRNIPFAAFGRAGEHANSVWLDVDGEAGAALAVRHLAETGRERIAFLGWPEGTLAGDARFAGWRAALAEAGLEARDDWAFRGQESYQTGKNLAATVVERGFDAVACASDTFALGMMAGLQSLGRQPGREIAVVGFDDIAAAAFVEPGLTTLRQPMADIGRQLVARLLRMLAGEGEPGGALLLPELVVRGSSAPRRP